MNERTNEFRNGERNDCIAIWPAFLMRCMRMKNTRSHHNCTSNTCRWRELDWLMYFRHLQMNVVNKNQQHQQPTIDQMKYKIKDEKSRRNERRVCTSCTFHEWNAAEISFFFLWIHSSFHNRFWNYHSFLFKFKFDMVKLVRNVYISVFWFVFPPHHLDEMTETWSIYEKAKNIKWEMQFKFLVNVRLNKFDYI